MSLKIIQQQFLEFMLGQSTAINQYITHLPNGSNHIDVYSEGYLLRLQDALADNFPAVHTLLGDDRFQELCRHYVQARPSTFFSIRYFGDQLAQFLQKDFRYYRQLYLAEMAQFEWALRNAFDCEDVEPITDLQIAQIPQQDWPSLKFTMHPHASLLLLHYDIPRVWKAINEQQHPTLPEKLEQPQYWLVWRKQLTTLFRSFNQSEQFCWQQLTQGTEFAELCESLAQFDADQAPFIAAGFIRSCIDDGLIVAASTCQ